ncbi:MAG: alpha-amylase family protein [Desulfococcaceae bacterium]|jgi:hypothetical protein|nr:alpha-amylase family protein [Desulfococcaceae bacterium]
MGLQKLCIFFLIFSGPLLTALPCARAEIQRIGEIPRVPAIAAGPEWSHFRVLIWPYQTDVLRDYDLYQHLGLGGFQIDRGADQEEKIRFSRLHHFPFYAGHIADKGYLFLSGENRRAVSGKNEMLSRPHSLADPQVISRMKAHMGKNIHAAEKGLVLAYALDDEISLGTLINPADTDIHPLSLTWFREWLKNEYQTIEKLNRQWETDYPDFNAVLPCGFEDLREKLSAPFSQWNLSCWADFRTFMDYQFAAVLAELTRYANEKDPDIPAGFVGGQAPSPWGGYDYARLCRCVQWMEAYDIHSTNEILRSFWNRERRPRMQTFFSTGNAQTDSRFLWYYFLHGNQAVVAWPEGWFPSRGKNRDKKNIAPHIQKLRQTFLEIQGDISKTIVHGRTLFDPDPVGIYYSHPSLQASWAADALVHGKTWPRRMSSIDNDNQSAGILRTVWCKTLEDMGFQYDFISYADVQEHKVDLDEKFRIIILPKTLCLSDREADMLRNFVRKGGVLIADYLCGLLDEHGKGRKKGALDDVFGIQRNEKAGYLNGKGITEIDGEKYKEPFSERFTYFKNICRFKKLAVYERGTEYQRPDMKGNFIRSCNDGISLLFSNSYGKGRALYLNICPLEYRISEKRFSAFGTQWRQILSGIFKESGLFPRVIVREKGNSVSLPEALFWKKGNILYLGIIRNPIVTNATEMQFRDTENMQEEPKVISLQFREKVNPVNLRTKKDLGTGHSFRDTFKPWEGNLYEIKQEDADQCH